MRTSAKVAKMLLFLVDAMAAAIPSTGAVARAQSDADDQAPDTATSPTSGTTPQHPPLGVEIMSKVLFGLLALGTLVGVAAHANAKADPSASAARAPGSCGQYMYWHDGKCTDARDHPAGQSWSDEMLRNLGKWHG